MEGILDVDGIAYCTLAIEGAQIPPTMNLIDRIYIQDGFAVSIPVMQLYLNDERGTLSDDMNIQDGTLVTIKISKSRDKAVARKFRVFSYKKMTTSAGPKMLVTCILDIPKWSAGVYTESIRGSSDSVMQQLAERAGLTYSGPPSVDDVMTWLNVNKTRSAFSEDVAMRGYGSPQTCMARVVTMDSELRYRDLFAILGEEPKWSLLQNTAEAAAKATPIVIRETHDSSAAGFTTHMMNYGQKQYEHSLNDSGQLETLGLDAPLLGEALPINEDVRSQIEDRGARVNYTGFDTGTEPAPASNLHQFYEKALYQNFRYLGLFSERLRVLTDENTEATTFDCVDYSHHNQDNQDFKPQKSVSGKWILGGKTIFIKAGHKYSEIYNLYRSSLMNVGASSSAGSEQTASEQNATANAGNINLVEQSANNGAVAAETTQVATAQTPNVDGVTAASSALSSMKNFAATTPLVPTTPISSGPSSVVLAAQDSLRSAVSALKRAGSTVSNLVSGGDIGNLSGYMTLKKYGKEVIEVLANGQTDPRALASEIDRMRENSTYAKNTAINRVTNAVSDLTGMRLHNIVSAASGDRVSAGAIIGDVLSGGMWADDLRAAGITPSEISLPLPVELSVLENPVAKLGTAFLHEATGLGFDARNILINPHETARNIEEWANTTDPSAFLVSEGARAYIDTFGYASHSEAASSLSKLGVLAAEVAQMYSRNELLVDSGLTDDQLMDVAQDILFTFGDPSIAPVIDKVERVVKYGEYHDVVSYKSLSTWATYYSLGKDAVDAAADWVYPFTFPGDALEITNITNGNSSTFGESISKWMNT